MGRKSIIILAVMIAVAILCGFGWSTNPWGNTQRWGVERYGSAQWGQGSTDAEQYLFVDRTGYDFVDRTGFDFIDR